MSKPVIHELNYTIDTANWFAKLRQLPWSVYLDSCGMAGNNNSRYDIMTACPFITITTQQGKTTVVTDTTRSWVTDDPFTVVQHVLAEYQHVYNDLPFYGGAIGYFNYDLVHYMETLSQQLPSVINIPDMAIGIYDWAIVIDHKLRKAFLVSTLQSQHTRSVLSEVQQLLRLPNTANSLGFELTTAMTSNISQAQYKHAFQRIQHYIRQGDCYQVNLSHCLSADYIGDPWQAYQAIRQANPAPFASYLSIADTHIMSLSPERFLSVVGGEVVTEPIKGTSPRASHQAIDQQQQHALLASAKQRAENLMIVDLLRHDLSKTCEPGSVQAPELCMLESFASVHHLVSKITGQLASRYTSIDTLRSCFPGGSVTGAPKIRAMQIIAELEQQKRSIYTGAIGYIDFNGRMDMNIAIRTLVAQASKLYCSIGGGIVVDSKLDDEYQETYAKIAAIQRVLSSQ